MNLCYNDVTNVVFHTGNETVGVLIDFDLAVASQISNISKALICNGACS